MKINTNCMECQLRKNLDLARNVGTEAQLLPFARDLMLALATGPEDMTAPCFTPIVNELFQRHFGSASDRYAEEKKQSNEFALSVMDRVEQWMAATADPVYAGLQAAVLGNYLDFSALHGQVSMEKMASLLDEADTVEIDKTTYGHFVEDCQKAANLLYITDNAGEIVFDWLLARRLRQRFPALNITFCVRGGPALNDANMEDVRAIGLDREFPVIDSGVSISGFDPDRSGKTAQAALAAADVVLSKGQGNVETLGGKGYPVYFAFLCKCSRFTDAFQCPALTVQFRREQDLPELV